MRTKWNVKREGYKIAISVEEPWHGRLASITNKLELIGFILAILGAFIQALFLLELAVGLLALVKIERLTVIRMNSTTLEISTNNPEVKIDNEDS